MDVHVDDRSSLDTWTPFSSILRPMIYSFHSLDTAGHSLYPQSQRHHLTRSAAVQSTTDEMNMQQK